MDAWAGVPVPIPVPIPVSLSIPAPALILIAIPILHSCKPSCYPHVFAAQRVPGASSSHSSHLLISKIRKSISVPSHR